MKKARLETKGKEKHGDKEKKDPDRRTNPTSKPEGSKGKVKPGIALKLSGDCDQGKAKSAFEAEPSRAREGGPKSLTKKGSASKRPREHTCIECLAKREPGRHCPKYMKLLFTSYRIERTRQPIDDPSTRKTKRPEKKEKKSEKAEKTEKDIKEKEDKEPKERGKKEGRK